MDNVIIHKISKNYTSSKLHKPRFEDFVDVFADRMNGWMLEWAEYLNKQEHAGFAVLHIGISYFESIAIFIKGEDSRYKSDSFFNFAVNEVFSGQFGSQEQGIIDQVINLLYKQGRCGFYHSGIAKKEIGLQDGELFTILEKDGKVESVWIDRYKFIEGIKKHLEKYISELSRAKAEDEIRINFSKAWNIFHGEQAGL